jgi:molybdopterin-containing oxidoreductase family membrane subunit
VDHCHLDFVDIILIVGGVIGVAQRLMSGHLAAGYGSYVPWGLWIGLYFLGIGISGGSFIIGAVGFIMGVPGFSKPSELRMAIVLSVAAMIPAFIGVDLDLGHMERLYRVLTAPSYQHDCLQCLDVMFYDRCSRNLAAQQNGSVWLKPLLVFGAFCQYCFEPKRRVL